MHARHSRNAVANIKAARLVSLPQHVLHVERPYGEGCICASQVVHERLKRVGHIRNKTKVTRAGGRQERGRQRPEQDERHRKSQKELHPQAGIPQAERLPNQHCVKHKKPQLVKEVDHAGDQGVTEHGLQQLPGMVAAMHRSVPLCKGDIPAIGVDGRNHILEPGKNRDEYRHEQQNRQGYDDPVDLQVFVFPVCQDVSREAGRSYKHHHVERVNG